MSYYFKYQFGLSDHAFQRIKQRLKINDLDDLQAKTLVMKLIDNHGYHYDDDNYDYFQVEGKNLYFVVSKKDKVILTLTPMSPEKLLSLYLK